MEPGTPRPGHKRLDDEPAEIAAQPRMSRHQEHGLLLVAGLAEGNQECAFRLPSGRTYVQVTDLGRSRDHKKVVGLLRRWQHSLEQYFILTLPDAWIGTFKNTVHHAQWIVRIETSHSVEPDMTDNLRSRSDVAIDRNSGSVEIRRSRKSSRIIWIVPDAPAPDTAKPRNRDQHFCHAPFKRLFFWRSVYNSSCSRLM